MIVSTSGEQYQVFEKLLALSLKGIPVFFLNIQIDLFVMAISFSVSIFVAQSTRKL